MARLSLVVLASLLFGAQAFVPVSQQSHKAPKMSQDDGETTIIQTGRIERGVSVDQDGKSNVWALEPKVEVSTKSSEETMTSALFAGGTVAVAAVAAGFILTNLPDPNQF